MTQNASFSFRLSENLKQEAFNVIENYGFTPSQVFNLFLTEIANKNDSSKPFLFETKC